MCRNLGILRLHCTLGFAIFMQLYIAGVLHCQLHFHPISVLSMLIKISFFINILICRMQVKSSSQPTVVSIPITHCGGTLLIMCIFSLSLRVHLESLASILYSFAWFSSSYVFKFWQLFYMFVR